MSSEAQSPLVDNVNVVTEDSIDRDCPGKKNKGKVPKRIQKAEREKLKREHLNDLFLDLASALELTQQNSGKASVLCEATRLLRDLLSQIECLKKEHTSLLSESKYVTVEKNELREENSALEIEIEKLQSELEERIAQSKPDLNVPPPEFQQPELTSHFPGDCVRLPAVEPSSQQVPAVFVLPICPEALPDVTQQTFKPNSNLSKPHARYPTPMDSWPSQLLGEQPTARKEF
ncbi:transcription factor bHLH47-like [Quercus suber]|nr:transcription factor bHLH47 [Quercus suber]POE91308.1 transcription factor bhlh47 [Quercus suber]